MSEMNIINPNNFNPKINELWGKQWFLLTSGSFSEKNYNTMTVAWGFFGIMWNKPVAAVVVRPTRHTFEFIEKYDTFTLTAFDMSNMDYFNALKLLGTKSGRDSDKIAETCLTIAKSDLIEAPTFKEAELSIECKKIYKDDFKPENFLIPEIENSYPEKDYHTIYFGEINQIKGVDKFN